MKSRRCFVISPIGSEHSDVRAHADDLYSHVIKPAAKRCGVVPHRADESTEPGRITEQMFRDILMSDFCIALLTGHNPNVFYEVAVAQAAEKPVIFLGADDEDMPFDVKDLRSVRYPRAAQRSNVAVVERLCGFIRALRDRDWKGESLFELHGRRAPGLLPASYEFGALAMEVQGTLHRLCADDARLLRDHERAGDAQRVFDGLYASILYASRAAISGRVDAAFYGNLMELDSPRRRVRVRFFAGPYNDAVSAREFSLDGRNDSVASRAFASQRIQVVNSMADELKVRGEARLHGMLCLPVPGCDASIASRQVVLLNIDAGLENAFPAPQVLRSHPAAARLEQLAGLLAQANALYRWIIEAGTPAQASPVPPGSLMPAA
jgi:hypothetical protein